MKTLIVEQGSEEWKQMRCSKIGASDVSAILGISPYTTRQQLLLEKTGRLTPPPMSDKMSFGHEMEPKIRDYANFVLDDVFLPRVVLHDEHDFLMASLDGMDFEESRILEIKCCKRSVFEEVLNSRVPDYYYSQLQHQLSCSVGTKEAVFFVYWPGKKFGKPQPINDESTAYISVKPDWDFINGYMMPEVLKFWDEIECFKLKHQ